MLSKVRRFALGTLVVVLGGLLAMGLVTGVFSRGYHAVVQVAGGGADGGAPTSTPSSSRAGSGASTASAPTGTSTSPAATGAPAGVLAAAPVDAAGRQPTRSAVATQVTGVSTGGMGGQWSGTVASLNGDRVLFGHNSTDGYIPASTMKLLTSTAALALLGPDHRFATRVVAGRSGQVILVGGGDPYLGSTPDPSDPGGASLAQLAARTAKALKQQNRTSVSLGYDDSLFTGPSWNPRWPGTYRDQVTPVSALWVDEGRVLGYSPGPRVDDPAADAGRQFAAALRKRGIKVSRVSGATAGADADQVAAVSSMPLSAIVGETLLHSDNDAAEVLLRQVGLAGGHTGSFRGGVAAVEKALRAVDAWDASTTVFDGSGLSRDNRVSSDQLVEVIGAAAADDHPDLRPLLTGMPTAAVDGSLRLRFDDELGKAGRGVLRAKTGTLTGVHSLAGWTVTRDGSVLAFAFIANGMTNDYASTQWLDHVASAVAACGCR